jgi:hypothetical protein
VADTRRTITITAGTVEATAVLHDTKTAEAIWNALPIEGHANRWGDEIYFSIGVTLPGEAGREVVDVGALGYWPPGKAFCIFFGPTPASTAKEPRAASPVNVFGQVVGDATRFGAVRDGTRVTVRRAAGP